MKLSKNFVKDYVDIDVDVKTLAEAMTNVGNEYDEAGKLITATGLTIGEVKTCEMHPDSDHLHICTVDIRKRNAKHCMWCTKRKSRTKSNSSITRSRTTRWNKNKKRNDKRSRIKWNDMLIIRNRYR